MPEFTIKQVHGSYKPRTILNCRSASLTIALAKDFTTAGERLTRSASGKNYFALEFDEAKVRNKLDKLIQFILNLNKDCLFLNSANKTLSIHFAGNGIYTMSKYGLSQKDVDRRAYTLLKYINEKIKVEKLYSGGQTGADEAGVKAALRLGISVEVNLPENNKVRFEDGVDVNQTILESIKRLSGC